VETLVHSWSRKLSPPAGVRAQTRAGIRRPARLAARWPRGPHARSRFFSLAVVVFSRRVRRQLPGSWPASSA